MNRSRKRPGSVRPRLEVLEGRLLPTVFLVTNPDDAGSGSLRQAILDANNNPGADTIAFRIGGGGAVTIRPLTALPALSDQVILDGTTQPGFAGRPLIALDGSGLGVVNGLTIATRDSTVMGLAIHDFMGAGIAVQGDNNRIAGNWIGTNVTGVDAAGNGDGVLVTGNRNLIGGATPAERNLISGNRHAGISFMGHFNPPDASDNAVQGNFIGTDVTGSLPLGNGTGITISGGALNNTIGGQGAPARNLISANQGPGVEIIFGENNRVQSNYIGTDVTGTLPLGNAMGVVVSSGANLIGGTMAQTRNLISGNTFDGVSLSGSGPVQGNYIGTDATGSRALGNGTGVTVTSSALNPLIGGTPPGAGNLISGNRREGLLLAGGSGALIQGNYIGCDFVGARAVPNRTGLVISGGSRNTLGGTTAWAGNLISGNTQDGIDLLQSTTNLLQGNIIGADYSGSQFLGNGAGIYVFGGSGNTIGGTAAHAGNLVSGNVGPGIDIVASGNRVLGNLVGTDTMGTGPLGNRDGVVLNGSDNMVGGRNVISGNAFTGLLIAGTRNRVAGNYIGTDRMGAAALGNRDGLVIASGSLNVIGGTSAGDSNLIAGNQESGVAILDGSGNRLEANFIGTDASGTTSLGNRNGVTLNGNDNTVGGTAAGAGNLIAGNRGNGLSIAGRNNRVQGNSIGLARTGATALANVGHGLDLTGGLDNLIGGTSPESRNVISGNRRDGVFISGSDNQIQGNFIGTDASGTASVGNGGSGVVIFTGSANTVGGTAAGAGNLIAASGQYGVLIFDSANLVQGNFIGTDITGTVPLANPVGVYISRGSMNLIGGTAAGAGNLISGNGTGIIVLANGSLIQGNFIGTDGTGTTALGNRDGLVISSATTDTTVGGTIAEARNLISGNQDHGVFIITSSRNRVQGNFIGTDVTGTQALPNGTGLTISGGIGNLIGGTTAGAGNLISGNVGDGIFLTTTFTSGTLVQGNLIGTDITGAMALGNGSNGVHTVNSSNNTIGGMEDGAGNVIGFSGLDGVLVDAGAGNAIRGNAIFTSANLGIELVNGGNQNQAFPDLTAAVSNGAAITISGTLTSTPGTSFILEFFADTVCNPSGYGEGEQLLGTLLVTTDANGQVSFTVTFDVALDLGRFVSATATDPAGNTSQFAACQVVTGSGSPRIPWQSALQSPAVTVAEERAWAQEYRDLFYSSQLAERVGYYPGTQWIKERRYS